MPSAPRSLSADSACAHFRRTLLALVNRHRPEKARRIMGKREQQGEENAGMPRMRVFGLDRLWVLWERVGPGPNSAHAGLNYN
jgi:hypothetical protein